MVSKSLVCPHLQQNQGRHPLLPCPFCPRKHPANCNGANRLSIICRAAAAIEGTETDAVQPEVCQQWPLLDPEHASVNLGFSLGLRSKTAQLNIVPLTLFFLMICQRSSLLSSGQGKLQIGDVIKNRVGQTD